MEQEIVKDECKHYPRVGEERDQTRSLKLECFDTKLVLQYIHDCKKQYVAIDLQIVLE